VLPLLPMLKTSSLRSFYACHATWIGLPPTQAADEVVRAVAPSEHVTIKGVGVAVAAPSERLLHGMLVGGNVRLCGERYPLAMLAAAGSGPIKERTASLFMVLPAPLTITGVDVTMALTMEPEALHLQLNKEHRLCDLWVTFFAAGFTRLVKEG